MQHTVPTLQDNFMYALTRWEIVSVSGQDAKKFLQGQLSCDMEVVVKQQAQLAACINLKGRVISNFIVRQAGENHYHLVCPPDSFNLTQTVLKKYAIFSKVVFEKADSNLHLYACSKLNPIEALQSNTFSIPALQCNFVLCEQIQLNALTSEFASEKDFLRFCIESGVCLVDQSSSEQFTVQEINLELAGGVSFSKGCYTGQEVVARLHYRGVPKRRAFIARLNKIANPVEKLLDENNKAQGEILNLVDSENTVTALISLSLEARAHFPEHHLTTQDSGAHIIEITDPPYPLSAR